MIGQIDLGAFDLTGEPMPKAMLHHVNEALDQFRTCGFVADLPQLVHRLRCVQPVDTVPGREVDVIAGRQVAFSVLVGVR